MVKDDVNDRYLVYQDTVLKKSTGRTAQDQVCHSKLLKNIYDFVTFFGKIL